MTMSASAEASTPARTSATPTDAVVRCVGLTKIFRDFWFRNRVRAVDGISLEVRRGEVFGLLGPNGSGKSTTIKLILGLLHPTSGQVAVFGKRPEDVATKKRIGYLPEESYLYRFLNARETLEYYGRLFHLSRAQRQRRIDELLQWVGLEHAQRRPVGEYSKGMQRKIGLAQALINAPELLILDEPTTGMDPVATRQFKDLILRLKRQGHTVLLCSHLLADVEDVCDRVAVMYGGRVQREGTVDELLVQQDMTTIVAEHLDAETIEQVEAVLVRRGKHIEKVDRPRQRLEALFLDIVAQAQARGAVTSGATSGGQFAAFLMQAEPPAEGAAVLERLVGAPADEAATADAEAAPAPQADADAAAQQVALKELVQPAAPIGAAVSDERDPPADVDQDLLAGLAGGAASSDDSGRADATAAPQDVAAGEARAVPPSVAAPVDEPRDRPAEVVASGSDAESAAPAEATPSPDAPPDVARGAAADEADPAAASAEVAGNIEPLRDTPPDAAVDETPEPEPPPAADAAPPAAPGAGDDAAPEPTSRPAAAAESGESPDQLFIEALQDVPPPPEAEGADPPERSG